MINPAGISRTVSCFLVGLHSARIDSVPVVKSGPGLPHKLTTILKQRSSAGELVLPSITRKEPTGSGGEAASQ